MILKSPSSGMLVWMVYRIFAPFSSSICFSFFTPACAGAGAGSASETSTRCKRFLPVIQIANGKHAENSEAHRKRLQAAMCHQFSPTPPRMRLLLEVARSRASGKTSAPQSRCRQIAGWNTGAPSCNWIHTEPDQSIRTCSAANNLQCRCGSVPAIRILLV